MEQNHTGTSSEASAKVGKYIKYAIGEIILVVIGILIALQINNWNESRKIQLLEQTYLNRLLQENKVDVLSFSAEIEQLENKNKIISDLTNAFKDPNFNDSLLVQIAKDYMIYAVQFPSFDPSTSTFEDLSSTGNLSVIEDTELRDQIVGHYEKYQYVEWNFKVNSDWAIPIDAIIFTNTDALKFDTQYTSQLFSETSTENLANEIRTNHDIYLRNAAMHYWMNKDAMVELISIKEETSAHIKILKDAINNKTNP